MANIQITIPDSVLQRVIEAIAFTYNYQSEMHGVKNSETKAQFAKRMCAIWFKDNLKSYEASQAAEIAKKTVSDSIDNLNIT